MIVFCMIPCTLAAVAYGADMMDGPSKEMDTVAIVELICACAVVIVVLASTGFVAHGCARQPIPCVSYVESKDNAGGQWLSNLPWWPDFAERYCPLLETLRGPTNSTFDRAALMAYMLLELVVYCGVAVCCAYGGARSRTEWCAILAASFLAFDAGMILAIHPMRSSLANVGAFVFAIGACVGYLLLGIYFRGMRRNADLLTYAIWIQLASLVFLGLFVEVKVRADELRARIRALLRPRKGQSSMVKIVEPIAEPLDGDEEDEVAADVDVKIDLFDGRVHVNSVKSSEVKAGFKMIDDGHGGQHAFDDSDDEFEAAQASQMARIADFTGNGTLGRTKSIYAGRGGLDRNTSNDVRDGGGLESFTFDSVASPALRRTLMRTSTYSWDGSTAGWKQH